MQPPVLKHGSHFALEHQRQQLLLLQSAPGTNMDAGTGARATAPTAPAVAVANMDTSGTGAAATPQAASTSATAVAADASAGLETGGRPSGERGSQWISRQLGACTTLRTRPSPCDIQRAIGSVRSEDFLGAGNVLATSALNQGLLLLSSAASAFARRVTLDGRAWEQLQDQRYLELRSALRTGHGCGGLGAVQNAGAGIAAASILPPVPATENMPLPSPLGLGSITVRPAVAPPRATPTATGARRSSNLVATEQGREHARAAARDRKRDQRERDSTDAAKVAQNRQHADEYNAKRRAKRATQRDQQPGCSAP
jgi:hypothetical protein